MTSWRRVGVALVAAAWLAGCAPIRPAAPPDPRTASIAGTVVLKQPDTWKPGVTVKVWLQDRSRVGAPVPVLLGEAVIEGRTAPPPIPFTVRYDPAQVRPDASIVLYVRVIDGDRVTHLNTTVFPAITRGCTADCEIALDRIR
ncbi:MAG: YbaY family lipoprotein [Burkholderiales bacterium]|jgi:putative lipoprotein|nr:YbaY family lipoprotein [Burkholderiales bacterium]